MVQRESSELEQNYGVSYKKNWEVGVVLVVDLTAKSAKKKKCGQCNTGELRSYGGLCFGTTTGNDATYDASLPPSFLRFRPCRPRTRFTFLQDDVSSSSQVTAYSYRFWAFIRSITNNSSALTADSLTPALFPDNDGPVSWPLCVLTNVRINPYPFFLYVFEGCGPVGGGSGPAFRLSTSYRTRLSFDNSIIVRWWYSRSITLFSFDIHRQRIFPRSFLLFHRFGLFDGFIG